MRVISFRALLFAALALLGASTVRAQQVPYYSPGGLLPGAPAPWAEAWAGFGVTNNWYGGWGGFNYAFNHNVWSEGLLLRGEGGGGHYDYTNSSIVNGNAIGFVNATYGTGAVLLGYRKVIPGLFVSTTLTGYVGAEYQNQNNPDPTADVRGTAWGVKFVGEMYSRVSQYQDFFGIASFSSAFDTWMIVARPGFLLTSPGSTSFEVWIGPDGQVFGNGHGFLQNASGCNGIRTSGALGSCKYDEGRIGGFLHIKNSYLPALGDVLLSGGYRKPLLTNGGPDGYYAQIGLYWAFR